MQYVIYVHTFHMLEQGLVSRIVSVRCAIFFHRLPYPNISLSWWYKALASATVRPSTRAVKFTF
jgi:hypothetical protein